MAKLIVRPIDPRARGSYQVRAAVLTAINAAQEAGRRGDVSAAIQAQLALENMLIMRLSTDDGTPVEDALAELSADQFDDLFAALVGGPSVGEVNAGSSNAQHGDTPSTGSRRGRKP